MGDISMTSDNQILVNSIDQTLPVITYDKQMTQKIKLNFDKLYLFDVKSFDSPIGGITNLASNLFAMKGNFSPDSQEYNEICRRIKLLRFYQGSAIDSIVATYSNVR